MDKYKDPYQYYYNPYSVTDGRDDTFGYGNYGYRKNGSSQNRYNDNRYNQNKYNQNRYSKNGYDKKYDSGMYMDPNIQVPIQMPVEDYNGMDEMDKKKMRVLYPEVCKKIQYYIDEECDKMDYSGSYMYDDYPEKEFIEMITDKIYEAVEKDNTIDIKEFTEKIENNNIGDSEIEPSSKRCGFYRKPNRWLRNTIQVMLVNEMYGRRCRRSRRRCYRKPICYPKPYYYRYPDFFE
ncbi:hypothetical protein [Vallitalea guaymasensis]|uniref:hypothetical protein n=1 Tax=Vallitalea guaymasensis TaxID=1185412 RepID=UPI000DE3E0F8|nr:hypothetical protein [Vallitalea guaymasensis]